MSANCDVIAFFEFMANLQPSRSRIPEAWSIKLTFSLTITFDFTKTENRNKKSLTQLSYVKVAFLSENANFLQKIMLTSAKLRMSW